jgi:N-acetylglucosamine malate deacetylase 1
MANLKQINEAEKVDVIVVTAHPDDAEIGLGGTMAMLVAKGKRVLLVNLTDGEPTPLGNHDTRMKEADTAAEILGISRLTLNCCTNRRLMDNFEARVALGDVFRRYRPEIVITMGGKTIMASPDHYQAQLITEAGVFYSRLTKWEEFFTYPVHTIKKLLYFPVGALQSGDIPKNSFLVDVSPVIDKKIDSILAYKSQFPPGKQGFIEQIRMYNQYFGAMIGKKAAELLMLPKILHLDVLDIFKV